MTIRQVAKGQACLPSQNPTKSYWHKEPSEELLGHRTTEHLPSEADVIIIGSGITGAFAAHFLKERSAKDVRVVMLEAREACWGATGRNGGHCQPLTYSPSPAVAQFELDNYDFLEALVADNQVPCDWVGLTGVHAFLTQDVFDVAAAAVRDLKARDPLLGAKVDLVDPSSGGSGETLSSLHLRPGAAAGAVLQYRAASLWPYKLVAWVLRRLLDTFPAPSFNLQTHTPATALRRSFSSSSSSSGGRGTWTVRTPRGAISAPTVLLATNGYTSRLLPRAADLLVPTRGQVAALVAPPTVPPVRLGHSYVFVDGADRDDYLVQRPAADGDGDGDGGGGGTLVFGGGRRRAARGGVGRSADDVVEPPVATYLRRELEPVLDLGRDGRGGAGLAATFEWTGCMGYSRDARPWVGAVPASLIGDGDEEGDAGGLWLCGGYTGHGMPNAALSARAVVDMMAGGPGAGLPDEYRVSDGRVRRAREMPDVETASRMGFAELLALGL